MKLITKITATASGLLVLAGLAGVALGFSPETGAEAGQRAAQPHVIAYDVAEDCRTVVVGPNRGDVFIASGKIFPAGTLPSGTASNIPTAPVNGVAPIGDFLVRGQIAFPFPREVASSYSSTPSHFFTAYHMFDGGRTGFVLDGVYFLSSGQSFSAMPRGIGSFSGAVVRDEQGGPIGTNATGCPNYRVRIKLVPGSVHGASNN